jgi:integrase
VQGEPGSPEFVASYNEAVGRKVQSPKGTLQNVLQQFHASRDFMDLADSTRRSYIALIKRIEEKFSDFPLSALKDRRTRGIFKCWRDAIADYSGCRQADYTWSVLARVLSWGLDRGIIAANPCERGGRLYRASRNEKIWTDDDEKSFLKHAPAHLHLALLMGLWTGQRQGDLLRLPLKALFASSKGEQKLPTDLPTGPRCSVLF